MTLSSTAAAVAATLKSLGLSNNQVDGALGNLEVESDITTTASNPAEGAIGLAQWEGGRRTGLDAYAVAHGESETDLNAQLGYMVQELEGPYASVLAQLKTATTPAQAATIWDQSYEVSAGTTRQQRITDANQFAAEGLAGIPSTIAGAVGSTAGGGTTATDASLTSTLTSGLGSLLNAANPLGALGSVFGGAASSVAGEVASGVGQLALKIAVAGAGLALVVAGLIHTTAPARDRIENTAAKAAPLAAAAA